MSSVYKIAESHNLIPEDYNPVRKARCNTKSDYRPVPVSMAQALQILNNLGQVERIATLIIASTGLRISECLGLQWGDVDWAGNRIFVRRTYIDGRVGTPKTIASASDVPMHPRLAQELSAWRATTPYAASTDWIFASFRLRGRKPRVANMMTEKHLRPAAVRAGVLVENDPRPFGFHALRHGLATYLITGRKADVKTTQDMLRHSNPKTTLDTYTHSSNEDRVAAQGHVLGELLSKIPERVN